MPVAATSFRSDRCTHRSPRRLLPGLRFVLKVKPAQGSAPLGGQPQSAAWLDWLFLPSLCCELVRDLAEFLAEHLVSRRSRREGDVPRKLQ